MDHSALVLERELLAGSPEIALFVEVSSQVALHGGHQHERPDIEFPASEEKRLSYIFLNNVGALLAIAQLHLLAHHISDFVNPSAHLNALASVSEFAWFDDPIIGVALIRATPFRILSIHEHRALLLKVVLFEPSVLPVS